MGANYLHTYLLTNQPPLFLGCYGTEKTIYVKVVYPDPENIRER